MDDKNYYAQKYYETLKNISCTNEVRGLIFGNWEFVTVPKDTTKERSINIINKKVSNDILENNMKRYYW